jgi:hypothetical protein
MGKQAVVETVVVDVEAVGASKPPYFQIRRRGE